MTDFTFLMLLVHLNLITMSERSLLSTVFSVHTGFQQ